MGWAREWLLSAVESPLPNPVGYATIAWPSNDFSLALKSISALGYKGVQILGWVCDAYQGQKTTELKENLRSLGLQPVALSCSKLHLDPAKEVDELERFRAYADFLQRLGGHYLQVTDGGRPEATYSRQEIESLARRMNALGKAAQDHGLELGYHPHIGTLGETRGGLGKVLDATDPGAVKLIVDVAHLSLGGSDPAEVIRTYRHRLLFVHFKDVRKEVADLARQNRELARKARHRFCEIGTGVVDFPAILRAFREIDFRDWVIIELDTGDPGFGGPDQSARKNQEAVRKLGFSI
jgi:inosose dehydratase